MIRRIFFELKISEEIASGFHVNHCFDYLRQAILCSADLALEGINGTEGATGWGVPHLCRNLDEVNGFMDSYSEDKYS